MRRSRCVSDHFVKGPVPGDVSGIWLACTRICALAFVLGYCWAAVAQTATTTTLSVTSGGKAVTTVAPGTVVTLTATETAGSTPVTPGTVNFCDATAAYCTDIHIVGSAQLTSGGTATFNFRPGVGSHSYRAVFVGTRTYSGSSSNAVALTVPAPATGQTTTTTIASSGSFYYTLVSKVSASWSGPAPTGAVSFVDASNGDAVLATATLGSSSPLWVVSGFYDFCPAAEAESAGVASADFNGDGIPDLAAVCPGNGTVEILLGNGDGTFTQAGVLWPPEDYDATPNDIVVGDFNGDGIPDLAVVSCVSMSIFLGNGDGTFTLKSTQVVGHASSISNAIAVADFNQDGILDLALASGYGNSVKVFLGNGDGTFTYSASPPTGNDPAGIAAGDFNGDGIPDLAVTNAGSNTVTILLGNGDGTFTPASASPLTGSYPQGIVAADLIGHGTPDLAVANTTSQTLTILLGNGDGTFTPATKSPAAADPYSIVVADFNGNGVPDLAVSQFYGYVNVLLGNGDSTFTPALNPAYNTSGQFLAAGNFNGNGLPGLATNYYDLETVVTDMSTTAAACEVYVVGTGTYQVEASYAENNTFIGSTSTPITLREATTAPPTPPTLSSPTPGSGTVLGTSNVAFRWVAVPGYTLYQLNLSAITPGASDLYLYKGAATSATVPTLPANGATVYARLYSNINGAWLYSDSVYTESANPVPAGLTTPTPGLSTALGTSNVVFGWTAGKGVTLYQLNLSAVAAGGSELFLYKGAATSATVPSLPGIGSKVYARLYSCINKVWQYIDYVYTESDLATLASPVAGLSTKLGASNVPFRWTAGKGATLYELNLGTLVPGAQDLFVYKGTAISTNVPSLPANGEIVYARLWSYINQVWQHNDYTFTESGTTVPAVLTFPTPGLSTVLGTSGVEFQWSAGTGVTLYELNLSAVAAGASDLYVYKGTATFANVPSLPANGEIVYARLWSYINNVWQSNNYVYIESGSTAPAVLTSPAPGVSTVLGTSGVPFQWSAGTGVTLYEITLGTLAPGAQDLFVYKGTATSATVPTLPANGVPVYARLSSYINKVWQHNDYVYTESGSTAPAMLTTPTPGLGTVLGSSNVQFKWTAGTGVTLYQLNLSAVAAGGSELYLYKGTATMATAPSLPANGVTVYARLYSKINGAWQYYDYVYTEK